MHPVVAGYRIEDEINRSPRSAIWRAIRLDDELPVVLKTINKTYPSPGDLSRIQHEARILERIQGPGIIGLHGLERWGNNLAIVLEDCGARSLAELGLDRHPMPVDAFVQLAIPVVRALATAHQQIVHKNLTPQNILWNPQTREARLIDFGCSADLLRDRGSVSGDEYLDGSLPYLAPEQTGRMHRALDPRTDLYSLGIVFYTLLCGRLPFQAVDPLEWIHFHLARQPEPPASLDPRIPEALSDVVCKLLAKNPEDRYQSTIGLVEDLETIAGQWGASGRVEPLVLGQGDRPITFEVPRRLYDRQHELSALLRAVDAAAAGTRRLAVVAGKGGVGKSALVEEIRKNVKLRGGWFLEGKVDQYRRQIPYSAIAQALSGAAEQILAEPPGRLATWKSRILETMNPYGRLAIDLVPRLAAVMGPQPELAPLNPSEEQNRFLGAICRLVGVFARREHPVVLFLDDLHWADVATLGLIPRLLAAPEIEALLIVCAFRDNEVAPGQPLKLLLEDLKRSPRVDWIQLGELDLATVVAITADSLWAEADRARPLGEAVFQITGGSPFLVGEFLRSLHADGKIAFDRSRRMWTWSLDDIRRAPTSLDAIAFMGERLELLPDPTQEALTKAAFLGISFGLGDLARALGQTSEVAARQLDPALEAGLVVEGAGPAALQGAPEDPGRTYRFAHDHVQQAAFARMPEDLRPIEHLRIGRLKLTGLSARERAENAIDLVSHLNCGLDWIADPTERLDLARLNLEAGRRSKASVAYRQAFEFLSAATDLLAEDAWQSNYELAFEIAHLYASCAYLCDESERASARIEEILSHCRSPEDRAKVMILRAAVFTYRDQLPQAIDAAIEALAHLGVRLSRKPSMLAVAADLAAAKLAQGRRRAQDLDSAPLLCDPTAQLVLRALSEFLAPAYLSGNDTLFASAMLKRATLCLKLGNGPEAVSAYASYAVLLAGIKDLRGAFEFGQLSLRLIDRFPAQETRCFTLVMYVIFCHSWSCPWRDLDPLIKRAIDAGIASGDYLFMAYACAIYTLWNPDIDLQTSIDVNVPYLELCQRAGYTNAIDTATLGIQIARALTGATAGPLSLSDSGFDEAQCLERMTRAQYVTGLAQFRLYKLVAACMAQEWEAAWFQLAEAERHAHALAGSPYLVELSVYGFMCAAEIARRRGRQAAKARSLMRRFERRMRRWAAHCPQNFEHHHLLMQAVSARGSGRLDRAASLFARAAEAADRNGYLRYRAHAHEAAADFFAQRGARTLANEHLSEAHYLYKRWGAALKVQALEAAFPDLSAPAAAPEAPGPSEPARTSDLDLRTVMKASSALAAEIDMPRLLEQLVAIMVENAGARRGALFICKDGDCRLEASFDLASGQSEVLKSIPLDDALACKKMVRLAYRTGETIVADDAQADDRFRDDPHVRASGVRSMLCLPIRYHEGFNAVLYLENDLAAKVFDPDRVEVLTMLASQAAVSIENSELISHFQEMDRLKVNFINAASHELRTPLASIKGYAEFLEDEIAGPLVKAQKDYVHEIQEGVERLRRLVDDLLDFARLEAGTFQVSMQETDLVQIVASAVSSVQPLAQRARVHLHLADAQLARLPVVVDPMRIEQVVLNLLGNALKFTPPGGSVTLSMTATQELVRVEVNDTGIGISDRDRPLIFEKFFQVDPSTTRAHGGAGLGLAISKALVEAHGGSIGAASEPGKGSKFWFTLPRRPA